MQAWRNLLVLERQHGFEQARDSSGFARVPHVSLNRPNRAEIFCARAGSERFGAGSKFDGVAERRSRAMSLQKRD